MKSRLVAIIKALIIIPCIIIGLFFSLRLGLFSYASRDFNCNKPENNCKIISKYLLSDNEDVVSIDISEIKKVITEFYINPKGFGHYALNVYTKDDKYTYLEAGSYFKDNLYNCSGIIANFLASKKNTLNLSYKISAFKSVMGLIFALCMIIPLVLVYVFKLDVKKYKEIKKVNVANGNEYLNIIPLSFSMLMMSLLSTFIISKSQIIYERNIGTVFGLIYTIILLFISILSLYQVFSPDKLGEFFKNERVFSFCSGMLTALIVVLVFTILIYGLGVVSIYMC